MWWWILTIIIAAALLWFVLTGLAGILLPKEKTGPAYLRRRLRKRGVDIRIFDDKCVAELINHTIRMSLWRRIMNKHEGEEEAFVKELDKTADLSASYIRFGLNNQEDDPVSRILSKYNLICPTVVRQSDLSDQRKA